jgi:hypothetical protein
MKRWLGFQFFVLDERSKYSVMDARERRWAKSIEEVTALGP